MGVYKGPFKGSRWYILVKLTSMGPKVFICVKSKCRHDEDLPDTVSRTSEGVRVWCKAYDEWTAMRVAKRLAYPGIEEEHQVPDPGVPEESYNWTRL